MKDQVIFVLDEFLGPVNGTEAQFWLLFNAMGTVGRTPKVATLKYSEYLAKRLPQTRYENLAIGSLFTLDAARKAFFFALRSRAQGVKVAHLYLNDVSVLLPFFLWAVGIKVIVSRRDLGFWYSENILRVLRINRLFVARVIGNCTAVKEAVVAAEHYLPREILVILNGVDPPSRMEVTCFREQFGVPAEAFVLGMVCNLRKLKRVDDAVTAVAKLKALGLTAHLMVAGEDRVEAGVSQRVALSELSKKLGVGDLVHFVGMINPSWGFLHEIDVFLSCSDTEGLSNSIIEAMICGKPVVATAVGGTPELLPGQRAGFLYDTADVSALTDHVAKLIREPALRDAMGRSGVDFAKATLSTNALLHSHLALYQLLARGLR